MRAAPSPGVLRHDESDNDSFSRQLCFHGDVLITHPIEYSKKLSSDRVGGSFFLTTLSSVMGGVHYEQDRVDFRV